MATKATSKNGHVRLEEALATLIQTQAAFVSQLAESERHHLEFESQTAQRFARIEGQMAEIIRVLTAHNQLLERLPEEIRDKIGFKPQV